MVRIPDFDDPRYLNEVGWFLYREKYGYNHYTGSFAKERLVWSQMLLDEFLDCCGKDHKWVKEKTVVTIGCGCTGDLAVWPAAVKIAVDPLLYTYQQLGMLIPDAPEAGRTVFLSAGVEEMPLLDGTADIVVCRNCLDHMPDPRQGLEQIWRVLKEGGLMFLSVDVGGPPTPDEPSPFTRESLTALLENDFRVLRTKEGQPPHAKWRDYSLRILVEKKGHGAPALSKERILKAYESALPRKAAMRI
jgi:ubiquinone/menaquinone biosynthesis C-methylase UbiE